MKNSRKLLSVFCLTAITLFNLSICSQAAQIDSVSVLDGVLRASVSDGDNARLYVVSKTDGVIESVNFTDISDGYAELQTNIVDGVVYLWDKTSLAPVSCSYELKDSHVYSSGSENPLPDYVEPAPKFDQSSEVFIVSSLTRTSMKGWRGGVETEYSLSDNVTVCGLADGLAYVTPGSTVLPAFTRNGKIAGIELLATAGFPASEKFMTGNCGTRDASDGSTIYKNIIAKYYSKSGTLVKVFDKDGSNEKIPYTFQSMSSKYTRVYITADEDGEPVVSVKSLPIRDASAFGTASKENIYFYMRYNSANNRVTEGVMYCFPKSPTPDDEEYSPVFSLRGN